MKSRLWMWVFVISGTSLRVFVACFCVSHCFKRHLGQRLVRHITVCSRFQPLVCVKQHKQQHSASSDIQVKRCNTFLIFKVLQWRYTVICRAQERTRALQVSFILCKLVITQSEWVQSVHTATCSSLFWKRSSIVICHRLYLVLQSEGRSVCLPKQQAFTDCAHVTQSVRDGEMFPVILWFAKTCLSLDFLFFYVPLVVCALVLCRTWFLVY